MNKLKGPPTHKLTSQTIPVELDNLQGSLVTPILCHQMQTQLLETDLNSTVDSQVKVKCKQIQLMVKAWKI
jgi:hypothetical protein